MVRGAGAAAASGRTSSSTRVGLRDLGGVQLGEKQVEMTVLTKRMKSVLSRQHVAANRRRIRKCSCRRRNDAHARGSSSSSCSCQRALELPLLLVVVGVVVAPGMQSSSLLSSGQKQGQCPHRHLHQQQGQLKAPASQQLAQKR